MKKLGVFIFVFLLFNFVFSSIVSAQSLQDTADKIQEGAEQVEDITNKITDSDARADYLKQEWTKILNNTAFGPFVNKADGFLTYSSPFFIFLLGIPYSLSWLFFLSLAFFVLILIYAYRILSFFEPFYLDEGKDIKDLFFIFVVVLLILVKIPLLSKKIPVFFADLIITFISNKGEWYFQLIFMLFVFLIIILLGAYSKQIESIFARLKKDREFFSLKERIKRLEEEIKGAGGDEKSSLEKELENARRRLNSIYN